MAKLHLQVQISVDGFIAGPKSEMDWIQWNFSQEVKDEISNVMDPADHIIMGHSFANGFIPHWLKEPAHETKSTSDKINACRKTVFTRDDAKAKEGVPDSWKGGGEVQIISGDLKEAVLRLKAEATAPILVYGGSEFVKSLIAADLIDDFHLFMSPIALGRGLPIFGGRTALKLVQVKQDSNGVVILHYQRTSSQQT